MHARMHSAHARAPAQANTTLPSNRREISNNREDCEKLERDQRLHDSAALKRVGAQSMPGCLLSC